MEDFALVKIGGEMTSTGSRTIALLTVVGLSCSGCISFAVEGVNITKDEVIYQRNIDEARAGDRVAQYKVGDALCCSVHEGSGFYNTKRSVDWLCRSARQGYGPAMFMVGKILSGDVIDGVRLTRRITQGVAGVSTNLPVAYGWLRAAERNGAPDAKDRADDVWTDMTDQQRAASVEVLRAALPEACTWDEVGLEDQG